MTTTISDSGVNFGNNSAAYGLFDLTASVAANAITVTLNPCSISFRSTSLTTGTPTVAANASAATLTIAATDSFGAVTADGTRRIVILAINNAGTIELAASSLAGGVALDETGVITTAATATTLTAIKAASVRTGVAYKVVGFVDVPFTTAVGWGALVTVQGTGGQALAAMQSLGYGQTWQNVTGSRISGTTYYNTTGKPIFVLLRFGSIGASADATVQGYNGITYSYGNTGQVGQGVISFPVPPGGSYSASAFTGWLELR